MKPHTLVLIGLALVLTVRGCQAGGHADAWRVQAERADSALAAVQAVADSLEDVRRAQMAEDSVAMAALADTVAAWRARKAEADAVAARARFDAENAAKRFLAVADSQAAALFEEYRASVTVELVAWQDRATDAEAQLEVALVLIDRKDDLLDTLVREVEAKDEAIARAREAIAARDEVISGFVRRDRLLKGVGAIVVTVIAADRLGLLSIGR